jgi:hypothetical protein
LASIFFHRAANSVRSLRRFSIAHPARPLHSIYIIAGKRRVFGAPNPKIIRELIEHFRLRVRAAESDREHDHHCEGGHGGSTSLLVDAKNNAASPL